MSREQDDVERTGADGALTLEMMRRDIAEAIYLDPGEIGDEDDLIDLGLDSVRLMSLTIRWNESGANVTFADLAEHTQLIRWWEMASASGQSSAR